MKDDCLLLVYEPYLINVFKSKFSNKKRGRRKFESVQKSGQKKVRWKILYQSKSCDIKLRGFDTDWYPGQNFAFCTQSHT